MIRDRRAWLLGVMVLPIMLGWLPVRAATNVEKARPDNSTQNTSSEPARDRHHRGKNEQEKGRVILPTAGPEISQAFAHIKNVVVRFDAKIQRTTATGTIWDKQDAAFPFLLSDPELACNGAKLPAFCLVWRKKVPPTNVAVAVSAALSHIDSDTVWKTPAGRPPPPRTQLLIALAAVLLSLILGLLAGRLMRRVAPNHPGIRTMLALIVALAVASGVLWLALQDRPHPTPGDGVLVASFWFFGAWLGGLKLDQPRVLKLAVFGGLLGLVAAEFALRQSVPTPPECWHGEEASWLLPASSERKCRGAFAGTSNAFFDHAIARSKGQDKAVLHIGDSMVFGSGVAEHETFVAHLDRRDPTTRHINISNPDTGPDHYLLAATNFYKRQKVDQTVLYVYPGNDLMDLDRPDPCCGGAALLRYADGVAQPRCEAQVWQPDPVHAVIAGPPPFLLQVAAQHAYLGAMACAAIRPTTAQLGDAVGLLAKNVNGHAKTNEHLTAVFTTLAKASKAAGGPLYVVVLPERDGLEAPHPRNSAARKRTERVLQVAQKAGLVAIDAWPLIAALYQKRGAEDVFAKTHARDFHYSRQTHAALATWLADKLNGPAHATPGETDVQKK